MRLLVPFLLLSALASCAGPGDRPRPNVLLVSVDSLRADHVGANGYEAPTTPRLDALAADGVVFRHALAPASWTLPSHVTLLTALPPAAHGVGTARHRLAPEAVTLAEVLRAAGYHTAGLVGGPLLRALYGHDQGFDVYDETMVRIRSKSHRGSSSEELVGLADAWLTTWRARDDERPFFLFLHLWDVHYDYDPPPPYDRAFDPDYDGPLDATDFEGNPALHPGMPARDLRHLVALYDGEILWTDAWIGRLLDRLDRLGVAHDTLVIVTSDHGDAFFEHGLKGHGVTLHEELIRIPMLMRFPGRIAPGRVIDAQARLQDVAPTILGLVAVPPPPGFGVSDGPPGAEGFDFTPWLTGEPDDPLPALPAYGELTNLGVRNVTRYLRMHDRKVVVTAGRKSAKRFYDLARDPGEQHGRPAPDPDDPVARRLDRMIDRWTSHWTERAQRLSLPVDLDPEHVERLRELGYLE